MDPIPVETPFDEYEAMRALRCECGGAFAWGERDCERLAPPREHLVLDRYTLTCTACGRERPIEFHCDTSSESYTGIASSAFGVALGLGPDGAAALLAAAAGERPMFTLPPAPEPEARPKRKAKPKPKPKKQKARAKPKARKPKKRRRS